MQANYDVVVVGAGPIGITTACSLKAIHGKLHICVIDKRPEPQRNHGLRINGDAVDRIQQLLEDALHSPEASEKNVLMLKKVFCSWRDNFVRTSQIEMSLASIAQNMGIAVLRDAACKITEQNFATLCESQAVTSDIGDGLLPAIFRHASVVIGADGSHSVVRKVAMKDKLSHHAVLRHLVELKYQTNGQMTIRNYKEASKNVIKHSTLSFETTSQDTSKPTKPVTLHLFVDEATYHALRVPDASGQLKGVFGNSWKLAELTELAHGHTGIKKVYAQIKVLNLRCILLPCLKKPM